MMNRLSELKKSLLTFSIIIISVLFVGYALDVYYEGPEWNDFCENDKYYQYERSIETETGCNEINDSEWIETGIDKYNESTGYCDYNMKCGDEYNVANDLYERNLFFINIISGLIAIIFGTFIIAQSIVSTGIFGAGSLNIIYGTLRYWPNITDELRVFVLGGVLVFLIVISYKKFSD